MNRTIHRGLVIPALACAGLLATAAPALAEDVTSPTTAQDRVTVVDEPDTSGLQNKWTFAPLGVPVFGVIDSVQGVPDRLF